MIAFSFMLFCAAVAAWIISADLHLRFAAILYAALAVAAPLHLGVSVALIVCAVAPAMFAFGRKRFATPVLIVCCAAGLVAAATGIAMLAFAPLLAAALAIAASRSNLQGAACALALVFGAASFVAGSLPALMAFSSAALLGLALQAGVEEQGGRDSRKRGIRPVRLVR